MNTKTARHVFMFPSNDTSCVAKRFDLALPSGDAPWICTDHSMIVQLFDKVAWIQKHIET